MVRLVNFADDKMTMSQLLCTQSAYRNGVDQVFSYAPHNIGKEFYELNKPILDAERGAGYWLWKPYFIWRALQHCGDNDILIYCDSGCELIADVNEVIKVMDQVIKVMDQDLFLFTSGHLQYEWCKMDALEGILGGNMGEENPNYLSSLQQVQASLIFIRVNDYTRKFIKEWLLWCQMPGLIDDSPSVLPNHPDFKEHRHDQAILSALAIRENITLHWWPDDLWFKNQRHRWPDDKYPAMLKHHRRRNSEYT